MNKIVILFSIIALFFISCGPKGQNKHLTYQNIIILSDMSSRIRNQYFPQKDTAEIHKIIDFFKNECVKPGEKIGDKSSIMFSAFSEKTATCIDLDKVKNLAEKQQFINSTGIYKGCGLEEKLIEFENTVRNLYQKINNPGLDLISMLSEKIDNEGIIKEDTFLTSGVDTTFIHYENHIYIFTDGYLEYYNTFKQQNKQYYFGSSEIETVRQYCISNNIDIKTAITKNESLGFESSSYKNLKNKSVNLHILETHERDKDLKFQTYKNKKGLRDNEILEEVWHKWAIESGFTSFEWKKY